MRIEPRQQILEVWRAIARSVEQRGKWTWGGRDPQNSISDAEQLLCLMYPATVVGSFKLDVPDETAQDVLEALKPMGDSVELPRLLVDRIAEYMGTYVVDGTPCFPGGSYFRARDKGTELTAEQLDLDVVDSMSMSVSLCLAVLGFLRVFSRSVRRKELRAKLETLEAAASRRLSAAMVALLRCFTVNPFDPESAEGRTLLRTVNQANIPERYVADQLRDRLAEVRSRIRDFTLGLSQEDDLDNDNQLFECGWSWGIVRDAPEVATVADIGRQRSGVAPKRPYLYSTVVALDGIADIFSERTQVLGLLDEEQQRLAQALQLRWRLTQQYWSAIARFGSGQWPLEDIPWRTSDQEESDYYSLLVTSVVIEDLRARRATDDDVARMVAILEELAARGRITRRPVNDDPALDMHTLGEPLRLTGGEALGPPMLWRVADFGPLLFKRAVIVAGLTRSSELRERLLSLAEKAMDHLWKRRLTKGDGAGLWDEPAGAFPDAVSPSQDGVSWYLTERIMESFVSVATTFVGSPIRSPRLYDNAQELLLEADHLFAQELLDTAGNDVAAMRGDLKLTRARLERARAVLPTRPGTAAALANAVLLDLDELVRARPATGGK